MLQWHPWITASSPALRSALIIWTLYHFCCCLFTSWSGRKWLYIVLQWDGLLFVSFLGFALLSGIVVVLGVVFVCLGVLLFWCGFFGLVGLSFYKNGKMVWKEYKEMVCTSNGNWEETFFVAGCPNNFLSSLHLKHTDLPAVGTSTLEYWTNGWITGKSLCVPLGSGATGLPFLSGNLPTWDVWALETCRLPHRRCNTD